MDGHRLQFAPDRSVDDRVTDDDGRATDQLGVDADAGFDSLAEPLFERRLERRKLAVRDRERARYVRTRNTVGIVLERIEDLPDLGQQADAVGLTSTRTKLRPSAFSLSPQIERNSASLSPADSLGLSSAACTLGSATTALANLSISAQTGNALVSLASENAACA